MHKVVSGLLLLTAVAELALTLGEDYGPSSDSTAHKHPAVLYTNPVLFAVSWIAFISIIYRGANLSPFGEIRFHLEIGHSRESCRSVGEKGRRGEGGRRGEERRGEERRGEERRGEGEERGRGGRGSSDRRICESSVSRHLQHFFPLLVMAGMDPPYSVSDWLTLGSKPAPVRAVLYFLYDCEKS